MLKLKKIKVDVKEKTPPPDFSKIIPKNVVPLEEQVHHVYEKRPDVCTVDIIVNNLKDMLALGTSILRPEASKHRVANSSRKQKLQVGHGNMDMHAYTDMEIWICMRITNLLSLENSYISIQVNFDIKKTAILDYQNPRN